MSQVKFNSLWPISKTSLYTAECNLPNKPVWMLKGILEELIRPFANLEVPSSFTDRNCMKVLPQLAYPVTVQHFLKILWRSLPTYALYFRLFPTLIILVNSLQPLNYFHVSLKWANSGKPTLIFLSEFSLQIALASNFPQTNQIWIFTTAKFSVTVSRPSLL